MGFRSVLLSLKNPCFYFPPGSTLEYKERRVTPIVKLLNRLQILGLHRKWQVSNWSPEPFQHANSSVWLVLRLW